MHSYVAIHRDESGAQRELRAHGDVLRALQLGSGMTWVHLDRITPDDARILEEDFGLHRLAIEDCLSDDYQRPKIDEYSDFTFMLVHGIDYRATANVVVTTELNLFVGDHCVISSTLVDMPSVVHLVEQARTGQQALPESPALLAYLLIDAIVDNMLPILDRMDDVTDLIEEEVLANANPSLLEHLVNLKRSVMRLSRMAAPQAHLMGQVASGVYPRLSPAAMLFRDIHDHQVALAEQTQDLRERAAHAVDMYHSALSIKQNETMRILSIVASIFLPLTLLAGIYGMNFEYMPELGWRWGYFVVLGFTLLVVAGGTYALFGRQMLGWGRDRVGDLASFALDPPVVSEAVREASRVRSWVMRSGRAEGVPPGRDLPPDPDLDHLTR